MPDHMGESSNFKAVSKTDLRRWVKRPLVLVVLALMVGLAAAAWGLKAPGTWLVAALAGLWVALLFLWGAHLSVRVLPLLFFTVLGVGLYHQALSPDFPPNHLVHLPVEEEVILSGHLARPSRVRPEQVRLYVAVEAWKNSQGWRPVVGELQVTAAPFTPPPMGTRVVVRGKLRKPRALLNPGSWNRPRQLAAAGIFRQMHVRDDRNLVFLASLEAPPLTERLRGGIRRLLQEMAPSTRALYLAMLLGDQGEITLQMRQEFSRTGTSHLVAISGLHLGALAAITYFLVFWLLRRFPWLLLRVNVMKLATLAAAVPVVAYAHLAGGSPATQRAEVMVLAYLLLVLLGRPREVWSALALAALVILTANPLLLFSPSFKLSFVAVTGLLYLVPRWVDIKSETGTLAGSRFIRGKRVFRWTKEALAVSLAASLVTAPLVAHHFQIVSLFGFLVNLAAIPLFVMLALPLGGLAVLAQALGLTPVAGWLLQVGSLPLNLGYHFITWVAGLPGSGLFVPTPTWLQVVLLYAVIFLLFPVQRSTWSWAGAALGTAVLAATVILPLARTPQALEVTILDSNAGLDGMVVAPGGQRLVVSAAWGVWPGRKTGGMGPLPSYLHWRQYRRLDAVIALRLNVRNAWEMLTLAQQFEIKGFWWKGRRAAGKVVDLMNLLGDAGRPGLSLTRMNPPKNLGGMSLAYPSWDRGQGVALVVTCQGHQVLFLPPLRRAVGERLPWQTVDSRLTALVAPRDVPAAVVARLKPEALVLYGSQESAAAPETLSLPTTYLTRKGAVSLTISREGATFRQWRP